MLLYCSYLLDTSLSYAYPDYRDKIPVANRQSNINIIRYDLRVAPVSKNLFISPNGTICNYSMPVYYRVGAIITRAKSAQYPTVLRSTRLANILTKDATIRHFWECRDYPTF